MRSAGKYVPPAASGSKRCYRASNALAGGQFLPRQIKGSPVQHRIRQEGSPCCWSLCGAAWRYAEKTASLPCRWRCGRKDQHKFTVRQRRLPHTGKGSYGLRSYLPASALFTAVKPVTSSAVTDIDCRARIFPFPQIRANSVNSPESVFCLSRLALQSIRLSCRGKYVFSAWFGPDGAVPHLTFSLFQRQNAPAGSKREFFACRSQNAGPCPVDRGTKPLPNAGTPQFRHDGRQQGARFTALTPAMWSNFPLASGKTRQHSARDQCAAVFPLRG